MSKLIYSKFDGVAVADHEAEAWARKLRTQPLCVSTENVIHAYRCLLKERFFTPHEVQVVFETKKGVFLPVRFDKDGRTHDWHEGFCDYSDNYLRRLL